MPNRWESSGRPLFVKTVYVNGNRHAILSQEDPLLHSRSSFFKKASRPNSPLSFGSDMSVTSFGSQDNSVRRTSGARNPRRWKDISSELQNCLVKLRLASSNDEKAMVSNLTEPRAEFESSTIKRQKWSRGRKKKGQNARERFKNKEPEDPQNKDHYRYVYHFENSKGKKNYCFVKISSEPPGAILDSVNDDSEYLLKPGNSNLVISAAFQNLVMSHYRTTTVSEKKCSYFSAFEDPAELYWNNYLTRTYYNSLSERVIQWLELIKKRKRAQKSEYNFESDNECIVSERTFLDKNGCEKRRNSSLRKKGLEVNTEGEVKTEANVEAVLSARKLERDWEDDGRMRNARSKYSDVECEGGLTMPFASGWKKKINQEKEIDVDSHSVIVTCRCEKNERDYANGFDIAKQEYPERNQKPIDKPNVTRTRPISVRELSPQQQKKTSFERIVWASDRDIGRPQLHIFIPTVPSNDSNEESLSECEPQTTEV